MTGAAAARALCWLDIVTATVRDAKLPGFMPAAWDDLASLVALDEFVLVGRGKQEMSWAQTVAALDRWSRDVDFAFELQRVEEAGPLVFIGLDERSNANGRAGKLETMTVFEFDAAGQLCRIDAFQ